MAATYEPIATTTLTGTQSTTVFSSISSAYTDLRLVYTGTSTAYLTLYFNNDTSALYSDTSMDGSGSAAASFRGTGNSTLYLSQRPLSSTIPAFCTVDLFSYAGGTYKTCLITYNTDQNGSGYVGSTVGLYRSTSAINQITISGNQYAGTTITLYGIKAA